MKDRYKYHWYLVAMNINYSKGSGYASVEVGCTLPYCPRATIDSAVTHILEKHSNGTFLRSDIVVTGVSYLGHATKEQMESTNVEIVVKNG